MATKSGSAIFQRRFRRFMWVAIGLLILISIGVGLFWFYLERTAADGRRKLAAAIAETDALDARWRWEEMQEDFAPIPDNENSMRLINKLAESLEDLIPTNFDYRMDQES